MLEARSFLAGDEEGDHRKKAMGRSEKMAQLLATHPVGMRLVELYRRGFPLRVMAEVADSVAIALGYLPEELGKNSVTKSAISRMIGILVPDESERKRLADEHRSANGRYLVDNRIGVFKDTVPWEGYIYDVETKLDELTYLLGELLGKRRTEFTYEQGQNQGKPNCPKIADHLNERFHRGSPVRTRQRVAALLHSIT